MSKKSNSGSEKKGFIEFLAMKTELPVDALSGDFRMELRGRGELYLHGCRRILKYSTDEMILAAKGFSVSIKGSRLVCSAYYSGTVCIEGVIEGFEIDDGKRGEED